MAKKMVEGFLTSIHGSKYEGNFVDNEKNGQGILTLASGAKYEGNFVDGTLNGQGVWTSTYGAKYEGNFVDGKKNGRGIWTSTYGNKRGGHWINDKLNGQDVEALVNDDKKNAQGFGNENNWGKKNGGVSQADPNSSGDNSKSVCANELAQSKREGSLVPADTDTGTALKGSCQLLKIYKIAIKYTQLCLSNHSNELNSGGRAFVNQSISDINSEIRTIKNNIRQLNPGYCNVY